MLIPCGVPPMQELVITPDYPVSSPARGRSCLARRAIAVIAAAAGIVAGAAVIAPADAAAVVPTCDAIGIGVTALHGPVFYTDPSNSPAMTSAYAGYKLTNSTGAALPDTWIQLSDFTGGSVALGSGQPAAEQLATFPDASSKSLFWYLTASTASSSAQNHTVTVYSHQPGLANSSVLCTASGGFSSVSNTIGANANKITSVSLSSATPTLGSTFSITVQGNTGTIGQGPPAPSTDPQSLWMSPSSISGWPAGAFRLVGTHISISPDGSAAAQTSDDVLHLTNLGTASRDYTAVYTFQATGFTASNATLLPVEQIASGTQIKHTGSYPSSIPAVQPATNDLAVSVTASPVRLPGNGGTASYTATIAGTTGASLDSFTATIPSGASVVPGSVKYNDAALADPVSDGNGQLVFQGPFTLTSGTDTVTFQLSYGAHSGVKRTSIVGTVGTATIDTTPDDLTDYAPATATVVVNTAPTAQNDSVSVAANSTSDTIPVLANDTDVDNDALSITGATQPAHGSTAWTAGALGYTPTPGYVGTDSFDYTVSDGNGGTATATVTVDVSDSVIAQAITFPALPDASVSASPVVTATSDSGLPVSYSSLTPSVCTVDPLSGAVSLTTTGTCTIQADQDGDSTHAAAPPVLQSFTVIPADQAITFLQPADVALAASSTSVSATADSALDVTFASSTPDVCTVNTRTGAVHLVSVGTCTIVASQPGDTTYRAAVPVTRSFAVTTTAQTITFPQPADVTLADGTTTVAATSDSGLPVTFSSRTPLVCGVAGDGTVTLVSAGTCTLEADQAGNAAYTAAAPIQQSFTVTAPPPAAQSITFAPIADTALLAAHVTASASADSGLAVVYSSATTSTCTVDATTGVIALRAAGTCTIQADQTGDSRYAAAAPSSQSFAITLTDQQITFSPLTDVTLLAGTSTATATSDSELAVALDSQTPSTCTVADSGAITLLATGACTIDATQAGGFGYAAAAPVSRTFSILRSPQTITFPEPPDGRVGDTVTLSASSGDRPITYTAGPSAVCVVDSDGTGVTLVGEGSCAITAHQAGDVDYLPASQLASLTVGAALLTQTITFPALPTAAVTDTSVSAAATASSGLPVTYTSLTPTACSVAADGALTLLTTGTCMVQADQAGDSTYRPAPSSVTSFAVVRASQAIDLDAPTSVRLDDTDVVVSGTATSALPVDYASDTPSVCSVNSAGAVTLLAAGTCTITASQSGSDVYDPADDVQDSIQVTRLPQTITLTAPAVEDVSLGTVSITATADSGLPVTVTARPARVCTVDQDTLSLLRSGACRLTATAGGNATYLTAPSVATTVQVTSQIADKSYTLPPASTKAVSDGGTTLNVLEGDRSQKLVGVTQPRIGRVTMDGNRIFVRVPASFRGTETFTYTTRDASGQRHTATITITVPDSAPTIEPVSTHTIAGSSRRIVVPVADANHDALRIVVGKHGRARVAVVRHRLVITPARSFSGLLTIPVTVRDGAGGAASTTVHVLVSPPPTRSAGRRLVPLGTRISWPAAPTAHARYAVTVDGRRLCVSRSLSCTVARFIGRHAHVTVAVFGLDGTHSTLTLAVPRRSHRQLAGTVYFATDSSTLSARQATIATALAHRLISDGFRSAALVGYTDSRGSVAYNLALSHRRSLAVARLMRGRLHLATRLSWLGKASPAATNATAQGMALNRRVEIWVS